MSFPDMTNIQPKRNVIWTSCVCWVEEDACQTICAFVKDRQQEAEHHSRYLTLLPMYKVQRIVSYIK